MTDLAHVDLTSAADGVNSDPSATDDTSNPAASGAPDSDSPSQSPDPAQNDPIKEVKHSINRAEQRINKLTFEKHELARQNQALMQRMEAFQRQQEDAAFRNSRPRQDQYQDYTEFVRADAEWIAKETYRKGQEEQARQSAPDPQQQAYVEQVQQYQQQVGMAVNEMMQEGVKKYSDFQQVIASAPVNLSVNPPLTRAILSSPLKSDLSYYLAKNPQEAMELVHSDPVTIGMKLGALVGKLSSKRSTNAPTPPAQLGGTGGDGSQKQEWEMTPAEWTAHMDKKERAKYAK